MKHKKVCHFRYFFYPFLAFLFGIALSRKIFGGDILTIVIVAVLFIGFALALLLHGRYKCLLILLAFFFIGNGFYFLGAMQTSAKEYVGECNIVARIGDDITYYNDYSLSCVLEDVKINGESAKNISAYFKVSGDKRLNAGDNIAFVGEVETAKLFSLGRFNSYYLRHDIGYTFSASTKEVAIIGSHLTFDESFRLNVKNMLNENMSNDNAAICYAMLFGDKSGMDSETKEFYQKAGIVHLLTVSGLHVGFLIALIYFCLRLCRLGKFGTTIVTSLILLLYNILCGFTPSVMRASLMALVMMLAGLSGRRYDSLNALGLAGFIILFIKPLYAYDVGFLMSFSCVASILLLRQPIAKILRKVMPSKMAEYFALSLSAQLGILPFLPSFATSVNLLSVFANLIIVPIFSFAFPLLVICVLISLIIAPIAKILIIFEFIFNFTTAVAKFFAFSGMQVPLVVFDLVFLIFIFSVMFISSRFCLMPRHSKFLSVSIMSLLLIISTVIYLVELN